MIAGKLTVVAGGFFGSEGKGAVAGHLARDDSQWPDLWAARVGGSNAGHTVYGSCPPECQQDHRLDVPLTAEGHPWRLRHVPVAAVTNPEANLVLAAGSEVDSEVLEHEVRALNAAGYAVSERITVDWFATRVDDAHKQVEQATGLTERLGSTAKGVGAARADRIMRQARLWGEDNLGGLVKTEDTGAVLQEALAGTSSRVLIEGTQGYGLGLHTNYYPFTTSGDCRAIDFLAQAGVSSWAHTPEIYLVLRANPIRVAGNSGPLLGETTWGALGRPVEHTTVTQKVRRVGAWDWDLAQAAIAANGGPLFVNLAVMMLDHQYPQTADATHWVQLSAEAQDWLTSVQARLKAPVSLVGTGPATMIDLR